jgi:hypothetical protein
MGEEESKLLAAEDQVIESLRAELEKAEPSKRSRILEKVFLAALSVIPWVGGVLSAAEMRRVRDLQTLRAICPCSAALVLAFMSNAVGPKPSKRG